MHAYVVVSLLTGARTEELRALTWTHLNLDGDPPTIELWRSVRAGGDTKTRRSRRTLELAGSVCRGASASPAGAGREPGTAGGAVGRTRDLVFSTPGSVRALDAANVRRAFRRVVAATAGLDPQTWTPRELRHSFVSLLSSSGVPIEDISHLVGHASTDVTEKVYRKELRPVLTRGARAMDALFDESAREMNQAVSWAVRSGESLRGTNRQGVTLMLTRRSCWWAILGSNQ